MGESASSWTENTQSISLKKRGMLTYPWKNMNQGYTRGLYPSSPVIFFTLDLLLVIDIKSYCEIRIMIFLNLSSMLVHKTLQK